MALSKYVLKVKTNVNELKSAPSQLRSIFHEITVRSGQDYHVHDEAPQNQPLEDRDFVIRKTGKTPVAHWTVSRTTSGADPGTPSLG